MADPVIALFSALFEVFGIMFLGFFSFRLQYLSRSDMRSLGFVLGRFCLPALLFSVSATIDFEHMDWGVIGCAALVRAINMAIAYLVTLAAEDGADRYLHAAASATCMISSDAAFGLPLVMALYPKFVGVLTGILATIALMTPLLGCMWVHASVKHHQYAVSRPSQEMNCGEMPDDTFRACVEHPAAAAQTQTDELATGTTVVATSRLDENMPVLATTSSLMPDEAAARVAQQSHVAKGFRNLLGNPILLSCLGGLVYRIAFASTLQKTTKGYSLPPGLNEFMTTTKAAFTFVVLFSLGESVEQNLNLLLRPGAFRMPLFLCLLKLVVTPLLLEILVVYFDKRTGPELYELRQFVVMYGLLPTSEAGIVWPKIFGVSTSASACTILLSTLLCGPMIFFANVFLHDFSTAEFEHALAILNKVIGSIALATTLLFLISFYMMGRRWLQMPMINQLVLAICLCTYYITGIIIYAEGDHPVACRSNDVGSRLLLAIHTGARYEVDFLIGLMAISFSLFRRAGLEMQRRLAKLFLMVVLLMMPCVFLPLQLAQQPLPPKRGDLLCIHMLPLDVYIDPPMKIVLILITTCALYSRLYVGTTEGDRFLLREMGAPSHAAGGQNVYVLSALAICSWLHQILHTFGGLQFQAGFLVFVGAGTYMAFGPIQFLMHCLRGECLEAWRQVFAKVTACVS